MPGGTISYTSTASSAIEDNTFYSASIPTSLLASGNNEIAVEIHQATPDSSDISFNCALTGTSTGTVQNPPSAPTNLNASTVSSSQINLTWDDNSGSESNYIVERSLSGTGSWSQLASLAANTTSYSDTGLNSSTTYFYRVHATNSGGDSANTNVASATTQSSGTSTTVTFIPTGSNWKYLDNGSNQGTAWRTTVFDDSAWKSGNAELGYGDGDEATVVGFGGNSNSKFITTYFRKSFSVADPSAVSGLTLRIKRDDGAVVYVNGTEVFRTNMPTGTIAYTTRASAAIEDETFYTATVPTSLLTAGNNVIAVEIHQADPTSSDISFDFELKGTVNGGTVTQPPPPANPSLPAPWADGDIGSGGLAGSASFDGSTFTVAGSGNDIWFNADGLHYVYQPLAGDGTIVAKVNGLSSDTNGWAKAGVMMRDSLAAGAKEASMTVSATNGSVFIFRTATAGASDGAFAAGAAPLWVKLIRSGSLFTGYQSSDGNTWTQIGSQSISMGSTIYVGLAVTSKNNAALNTATFSNVSITTSGGTTSTLSAKTTTTANFSTAPITTATTTTTTKKKTLIDGLV
jgi:regulation of enolase protein 1 (concanavalin A-like superfamily)